jgi:hypothetical protein
MAERGKTVLEPLPRGRWWDTIEWGDIDAGIVAVVRFLCVRRFPTDFSCQGGAGHMTPLSMVTFSARRGETPERSRDEAAKALLGG